jgi:uncharacterized membrane protein YedE/YeeE
MKHFIGLVSGLLLGIGLAASGMTNTNKVIGFLDVFGYWDPDLLFVMGTAVLTSLMSFRFILKRQKPVFNQFFSLPNNKHIDAKLLMGAILFGIGWGLYGYCPGPAIASIVYLQPVTAVFIITLLVGMFIGDTVSNRYASCEN